MALHNALGKEGEHMAETYLLQHGYTILHKNWKYSYYEIDIIALKKEVLHIIEVKIRSSNVFGLPEENVTKKKFKRLLQAADQFLFQHPQYRHVQYDILAINKYRNEPVDYFLLEDVYL